LLVLCSRESRASEVCQLLDSRSFGQAIVTDLPEGYSHRLFEFATSCLTSDDIPEPCATRSTDLSMKRNLGLVIARMLGWGNVFFMDDDIRDINSADLHRTVSMLEHYRSVGMRVTSFPDNSVVCHAHRETGEFQDVLVSGSALAVDCAAPVSFFPDIYNEDWLFFYDDVTEGRLGSSGLNATQLRYDPFENPQRAARQEFGDVLAEGLYALLHGGDGASSATRYYWEEFLAARIGFLDAIIGRAGAAPAGIRDKMLAAVRAARECSTQINPDRCAHYVRLWRSDLADWEQKLKAISAMPDIHAALNWLGLTAAEAGGIDHEAHRSAVDRLEEALPGPVLIPYVATLNGLPSAKPVLVPHVPSPANTGDTALLLRQTAPPVGEPAATTAITAEAQPSPAGRLISVLASTQFALSTMLLALQARCKQRRRIPHSAARPWRRGSRLVTLAAVRRIRDTRKPQQAANSADSDPDAGSSAAPA